MSKRDTEQQPLSVVVPATPAGRAPRQPTFVPTQARHPGRPAFLTREVEEKFMTALRAGNSIADAAQFAGMKPGTVYSWDRRGRGMGPLPATPEYVRFARLMAESRATARVYIVSNVVARSRISEEASKMWLRTHGGPEWGWLRGEEYPQVEPGSPAPAEQTNVTYQIDARTQTLVLPPEAVPDVVHAMLEQRRAEQPPDPIIVTEEPRPYGDSRARRNGLREDG